jgi:hypothetical protein
MTLELTLTADLEQRLRAEAERRGQPPATVALELLDRPLPLSPDERRAAAVAMLER